MDLLDRALSGDGPLPRTALVVAHPDDETLGAGARLARLRDAWLVHVTDGAPRDGADARAHGFANVAAYAAARRAELDAVCERVGLRRRLALEVPDQQAVHALPALARELAALFRRERIALVLTHPYEGGHPDHDATAFAVHAARALVDDPPVVAEMGGYHRGPDGGLETCFLPADGARERRFDLSGEERRAKEELLGLFRTQAATLAAFLPAAVERFRVAPAPDFRRPPHPGPLWYERFRWGCDGATFLELARIAAGEIAPPI